MMRICKIRSPVSIYCKWLLTEYYSGDIFVVHISGSYGTVVVKINIWLPNLIEIEREYTVPYLQLYRTIIPLLLSPVIGLNLLYITVPHLPKFYGHHHDLVDRYLCHKWPRICSTFWSFSHSWIIAGFVTRLTRRMSLVEQELLILPEHLNSPPVFSGIRVTRSLVLYICFVDRWLSYSTISFGHCLVCSSWIYGFWLPRWYLLHLIHSNRRMSQ